MTKNYFQYIAGSDVTNKKISMSRKGRKPLVKHVSFRSTSSWSYILFIYWCI